MNILIVDDEAQTRQILINCLKARKIGKTFIEAKDGIDAAWKIRNQHFDLIITDNIMPRRTGVDMISDMVNAHKMPPDKFLVISGSLSVHEVTQLSQNGIYSILTKPVSINRLINQVSLNLAELSEKGLLEQKKSP